MRGKCTSRELSIGLAARIVIVDRLCSLVTLLIVIALGLAPFVDAPRERDLQAFGRDWRLSWEAPDWLEFPPFSLVGASFLPRAE